MNTHFLIRTPGLKLFGPITPPNIVSHIQDDVFDIEAEISGDLGPWVQLDDSKKMQQFYPQIYQLLKQENLHVHAMDNL